MTVNNKTLVVLAVLLVTYGLFFRKTVEPNQSLPPVAVQAPVIPEINRSTPSPTPEPKPVTLQRPFGENTKRIPTSANAADLDAPDIAKERTLLVTVLNLKVRMDQAAREEFYRTTGIIFAANEPHRAEFTSSKSAPELAGLEIDLGKESNLSIGAMRTGSEAKFLTAINDLWDLPLKDLDALSVPARVRNCRVCRFGLVKQESRELLLLYAQSGFGDMKYIVVLESERPITKQSIQYLEGRISFAPPSNF